MNSVWTLDKLLEKELIEISPYWSSLSSTCILFLDILFSRYRETDLYKRNIALNIKTHEFTTCEELYNLIGLFSIRFEIVDKLNYHSSICINKKESFYITNLELIGNSDLIFYFNHLLKSYGSQKIVKIRLFSFGTFRNLSGVKINWNNLLLSGLLFDPIEIEPNNIFDLVDNLGSDFNSVVDEKYVNYLVSKIYKYNFKYDELNIKVNLNLYDLYNKMLINNGKNNMSILVSSFKNLYLLLDEEILFDFIHSHNWSDIVYLSQLFKMYNIKIKYLERYNSDFYTEEELKVIHDLIKMYLYNFIAQN